MKSIGIDIGATHIGTGVVEQTTGEIVAKNYVLLKKGITEKELQLEIQNQITIVLKKAGKTLAQIEKIGIACPGDCNVEKGIVYKPLDIIGKDINMFELMKDYDTLPIYIENDGNCALYAETIFGNLKKAVDGICVTVGTNIGCGLMKQASSLMLGNAMSQYHTIFADMEHTPSLKRLTEQYQKRSAQPIERLTIFKEAEAKIPKAEETLLNYLQILSIGLSKMADYANTKNICLGGGLSEHDTIIFPILKRKLEKYNFEIAYYKNDAAIVGAGLLPWKKEKFSIN